MTDRLTEIRQRIESAIDKNYDCPEEHDDFDEYYLCFTCLMAELTSIYQEQADEIDSLTAKLEKAKAYIDELDSLCICKGYEMNPGCDYCSLIKALHD